MAGNETTDASQKDIAEKVRKTAEDEVEKAMESAMASLPVISPGENQVTEQSSFLRKNLSVEKNVEDEVVDTYVEPMPDPYGKAIKYLEQHNVMQLFQQLTASIVYNKPEKPLEFMMTEVEKLKKLKVEEKEKK